MQAATLKPLQRPRLPRRQQFTTSQTCTTSILTVASLFFETDDLSLWPPRPQLLPSPSSPSLYCFDCLTTVYCLLAFLFLLAEIPTSSQTCVRSSASTVSFSSSLLFPHASPTATRPCTTADARRRQLRTDSCCSLVGQAGCQIANSCWEVSFFVVPCADRDLPTCALSAIPVVADHVNKPPLHPAHTTNPLPLSALQREHHQDAY